MNSLDLIDDFVGEMARTIGNSALGVVAHELALGIGFDTDEAAENPTAVLDALAHRFGRIVGEEVSAAIAIQLAARA